MTRKWKGREEEVKEEGDARNYDVDLVEVWLCVWWGCFSLLYVLSFAHAMREARHIRPSIPTALWTRTLWSDLKEVCL